MKDSKSLIRLASVADAPRLLEIYAPYVTDTVITFEYDVPSLSEFEERIQSISAEYPYLVYVENGVIGGYAYAHRMLSRAAYQWIAELSVYLAPEFQKKGIGTLLYQKLMELLELQNVCGFYALVTSPNPPSDRLHEKLGFSLAGMYHRSGFKHGKWHDVSVYERLLPVKEGEPDAFVPFWQLSSDAVKSCLYINKERE